jgi:hypothetical protein
MSMKKRRSNLPGRCVSVARLHEPGRAPVKTDIVAYGLAKIGLVGRATSMRFRCASIEKASRWRSSSPTLSTVWPG